MTRIINIKVDEERPQVVKRMTADDYKTCILRYKFSNPVKFEAKMEELKRKYEEVGGKWADIEKGILANKRAEVEKLETELKLAKDDKTNIKIEKGTPVEVIPVEKPKEEPKKSKK